jgi:hypothetical protein
LGLEIADLFLDWDFYAEIRKTGLVAEETEHYILGFAILGTLLFLGTVLNKCVTVCDDRFEEEDDTCGTVLSLLSTVFEDLPQIILALIVASTTTGLLSPIQIVKAVYGIIEPLIQIALNCREYSKLRKKCLEWRN